MPIFRDRADAGKQLAARLTGYGNTGALVLALPRGGVPVGLEIARALKVPLDVLIVRKLGVPGHEELAFGALASGGVRVLNDDVIVELAISRKALAAVIVREQCELRRREKAYRGSAPPRDVSGRTVLLIDDGLATGATMLSAIVSLRARNAREIVAAVPVAPAQTLRFVSARADAVVCLATPEPFRGVGAWYADFRQIGEEEVQAMLPPRYTTGA